MQKRSGGKIKYGQYYYDFSNGGLSFISPHLFIAEDDGIDECSSLTILIHPDFFTGYTLAKKIRDYGFFSYNTNETLQLTAKKKEVIAGVFDHIRDELQQRLDHFSQDVIISRLALLLNYSNRFYNRQFITQRVIHNDLLSRMGTLPDRYFNETNGSTRDCRVYSV